MKNRGHISYHLHQWWWASVDLFYQPECAGCGAHAGLWCEDCRSKTQIFSDPECEICGLPLMQPGKCIYCIQRPHLFTECISLANYEDPFRKMILRLKSHKDYALADAITQPLIEKIKKRGWKFDMILPVPLGTQKLMIRGYNQSEMIAHSIHLYFNIQMTSDALIRVKETREQAGLPLEERRHNLAGAFGIGDTAVKGKNILLIDDVMTTGATLDACTYALKMAGAGDVYAATLARAVRQPSRV